MYDVAPVEAFQLSDTEVLPAVAVSPVGAEGALLAPEELELLELEDELLELELLEDDELDEDDELEDDEPPEPIWTTALVLVKVLT